MKQLSYMYELMTYLLGPKDSNGLNDLPENVTKARKICQNHNITGNKYLYQE